MDKPEIAGVPEKLLDVLSKRASTIEHALAAKLAEFRSRQGREPSRWERAVLEREASADIRGRKSGHGAAGLAAQWRAEADAFGWTASHLRDTVAHAANEPAESARSPHVKDVIAEPATRRSTWGRADAVQAICDRQQPLRGIAGERWAELVEHAADRVTGHCVDLDTVRDGARRGSDGRSVWIEPTASRFTSQQVLVEEVAARDILNRILAHDRADPPAVTQRRTLARDSRGNEPTRDHRPATYVVTIEAIREQARRAATVRREVDLDLGL